ncbi:zinc-binding dehydrogenase [Actinomadura rugatobispora]|uniref:Zinc-binding dehydrogenase n=1 Tax=Actinomadura rugatobispora TaxID=1994 RepID=A0ABW0ZUX7_9ACTN|nr:zinc-binding dehydrogenase [Actinomadura rugatobispora]
MLAAFTAAGGVAAGEVPEPVPGEGQVLVAPLSAGICGSDLHLVDAVAGLGDDAPRIVLGHEFCAEILEAGPGTSGRFAPGTRVVSVPHVLSPSGPVDLGLSPVLPGGFAQRAVMQESFLLRVPDGLPDDHAALTEPLAVAVHAVRAARPGPEDAALVVGCGPIGLAVIAALKADGHGPVVAADFSPARRTLAERLGADIVLDPAESSPYDRWAELGVVERPPSPLLGEGVPPGNVIAFECVGAPGLIQQIIEGVPRHSRIVVVGVGVAPDTITPVSAILKEVSLTFVFAYRQQEFAHALGLLADGRVDGNPFVTGTVGLGGVAGAFADLRSPDEHVKIIVRPR